MKLLVESISVKNFGANAQKIYLINFWYGLNSANLMNNGGIIVTNSCSSDQRDSV